MNVQELVAQTFDEGGNFAVISARMDPTTETARQCANTVNPGLTATKERLHE